jgi:cellulose synthase/poly-beta-1,6-N-acetylglucosamine synthase-like glycosyltransferase
MIKYSIIVPAYQAEMTLPQCLAALQDQTLDRATYEIIVVDDGSTDDTANVAEHALSPANRVIRASHGGPGHARNIGARAACGEVLVFTDADCEPVHDWLAQITAPFSDTSVCGVKGAYRTRQKSLIARFVQQEYQDKYDRLARQATIDFVDTYSAAYRREVFEAVGGFNPALIMDEDQELSFRLAARGYKLIFARHAIVCHQHVTSLWRYARRKFGVGYWKALVVKQHPDKVRRDSHTPQVVKFQMGALALALVATVLALMGLPSVVPMTLWVAFIVSALPLLRKIALRDPGVMIVAPIMIGLRAFSLGLGLTVGLIKFARQSSSRS